MKCDECGMRQFLLRYTRKCIHLVRDWHTSGTILQTAEMDETAR